LHVAIRTLGKNIGALEHQKLGNATALPVADPLQCAGRRQLKRLSDGPGPPKAVDKFGVWMHTGH
jgi:hypothetical protein